MGAGKPLLIVQELEIPLGRSRSIKGEIHVEEGEFIILAGSNGSGRSTFLKGIMGVMPRGSGVIWFHGVDVSGWSTGRMVRGGISLIPEGGGVFQSISVIDNLYLGGRGRRRGFSRELEEVFELFPLLADRRNQLAGTLSGGERQLLSIARILILSPRVVLIDEPTLGLSPPSIELVFGYLKELNRLGYTIVMADQEALHFAQGVVNRGYLMEDGRVVVEGSLEELILGSSNSHVLMGGGVGD